MSKRERSDRRVAWPLLERIPLADFRVFRVRKDVARSPRTGLPHDFFVLEGNDWVNVIALTPAREIVLVRQFRHGTGEETLEIPGGGVEKDDPSPVVAAQRELLEETGYESAEWKLLGAVDPNPALQSNRCYTFLARNVRLVRAPEPDPGEDLAVELRPVTTLSRLVTAGEIKSSLVVAALHWFALDQERDSQA